MELTIWCPFTRPHSGDDEKVHLSPRHGWHDEKTQKQSWHSASVSWAAGIHAQHPAFIGTAGSNPMAMSLSRWGSCTHVNREIGLRCAGQYNDKSDQGQQNHDQPSHCLTSRESILTNGCSSGGSTEKAPGLASEG